MLPYPPNIFVCHFKVPTEDGPRNVVAPATRFNGKHRELRKVPRLGLIRAFGRAHVYIKIKIRAELYIYICVKWDEGVYSMCANHHRCINKKYM